MGYRHSGSWNQELEVSQPTKAFFFQGTDALGSLLSCTLWGTVYSPPYYLGISPGAALSNQMLILASIECPTVLRSTLMVTEMGSQDD